jgi:signal transduction histidine kinase
MKWFLEGKSAPGAILLTLFLMGFFRLVSWRNTTALLALNQQIQQSEAVMQGVMNRVTAIGAALTDAEAGRLTYLMLDDAAALKRHLAAFQDLEQQVQQLNRQLAPYPELQSDLSTLQTLIAQRQALASQTINLHQTDPTVTTEHIRLNDQLTQNRLAITTALTQIQTQQEQQVQIHSQQAAERTQYHLNLERQGTVLIFAILLAAYGILCHQMMKRKDAEIAQQQLAQANAISELKLNLFSLLSHEFRTPLSIILGAAQFLARSDQPWSAEKRVRNLDRIQSSARSMNQLLTDMLTLARAESGKLECQLTQLDLESFCLNLIEARVST